MASTNQGFDKGPPVQVTKPQVLLLRQSCHLMAGRSPLHVNSSGSQKSVHISFTSGAALQPMLCGCIASIALVQRQLPVDD